MGGLDEKDFSDMFISKNRFCINPDRYHTNRYGRVCEHLSIDPQAMPFEEVIVGLRKIYTPIRETLEQLYRTWTNMSLRNGYGGERYNLGYAQKGGSV